MTKIRAPYLAALEEERFETLPPRPYSTGYLRTYAIALGLDPQALLAAFEGRLPPLAPTRLSEAVDIPLEPPAPPSRVRRMVTVGLWILIPLVIFLAVVLYVNVRDLVRSGPQTVPSPPAVASATPRPAPSPTPAAGVAPAPALSPAAVSSPSGPAVEAPITLVMAATGESWLRVTVDGRRAFQGHVFAGETRTWSAERELEIKIGNAAVVEVTVNGRSLGVLGRPGQVVTLRFPGSLEEP